MTLVGNKLYLASSQGTGAYSAVDGGLSEYEIDGITSPSANILTLKSNEIKVSNSLYVGKKLDVGNSINVGSGGVYIDQGVGLAVDGPAKILGNLEVNGEITKIANAIAFSKTQIYINAFQDDNLFSGSPFSPVLYPYYELPDFNSSYLEIYIGWSGDANTSSINANKIPDDISIILPKISTEFYEGQRLTVRIIALPCRAYQTSTQWNWPTTAGATAGTIQLCSAIEGDAGGAAPYQKEIINFTISNPTLNASQVYGQEALIELVYTKAVIVARQQTGTSTYVDYTYSDYWRVISSSVLPLTVDNT
jgi:hypothetical protein